MKKYAHLLIIFVLSLVTIFGLLRLGHIDISMDTLRRVHWFWLGMGFVAFYASVVARGLRWQRILKTMGWPVGFVYSQTLLTAGLFLSGILPARAGDIGRVAMLKQDYKVPVASGVASIAAERALDVFSVLVLTIIGAMWALQGHIPQEWLQLIIGTGMLFILAFVGLLVMPSVEGWLRQPGWVWRMVPLRLCPFYQKIVDFGFALIHAVRDLGQKPLALGVILIESFVIWILDAVIVHTVLLSLGINAAIKVSLVGSMVGVLATIAPIMPGALGQYEAGLIALLTLLGVPTAEASLAALVVRFISLWTFIPVSGLITYIFGFSRALSLNPKSLKSGEISAVTSSR